MLIKHNQAYLTHSHRVGAKCKRLPCSATLIQMPWNLAVSAPALSVTQLCAVLSLSALCVCVCLSVRTMPSVITAVSGPARNSYKCVTVWHYTSWPSGISRNKACMPAKCDPLNLKLKCDQHCIYLPYGSIISSSLVEKCTKWWNRQATGPDAHSQHCFPVPSSKLCQI